MPEETKKDIQVVLQLPQVPTKIATDNDGNEIELMTIEDAITEMLVNIRAIKKSIA